MATMPLSGFLLCMGVERGVPPPIRSAMLPLYIIFFTGVTASSVRNGESRKSTQYASPSGLPGFSFFANKR